MRCFYGINTKKKKITDRIIKKRNVGLSRKDMIKCPFLFKYSYLKYPSKKQISQGLVKPLMYYKVHITGCNYEHTCELSELFYSEAQKASRGQVKIDLDGMNALLVLLKDMPNASPQILRPIMLNYIDHKQGLDAKFIGNFRKRVALYHARLPNFQSLPMEHAQQLISTHDISSKEYKVLCNPVTRVNFNNMFRKIMRTDCTI